MPSRFRQHQRATVMARAVVAIFAPLLRDEEVVTAFEEVYAVIRAGVEAHDRDTEQLQRRLGPQSPPGDKDVDKAVAGDGPS